MSTFPPFNEHGDLPVGLHKATLQQLLDHFGQHTHRRKLIAKRLEVVFSLAISTHKVRRFIIYGSFVTAKLDPGDVDVFIIMQDDFDASQLTAQQHLVFDHGTAHNRLGASVFWARRQGLLGGEQDAIEDWQHKRDGTLRGIVEVIKDDQQ